MRLFVALELPWSLREILTARFGGLAGARWVAPETMHLTLRFVGEVQPHLAEEVDHALAALRCRRFELVLAGTGVFERGRSTTLWAGVARNERLEHLQGKVETALQRAGVPADRRRFQPHVSLARVDAVAPPLLAGWVQAHNLLRTEPVAIDGFTLFSAQPGPDQPVYTAEVDYELSQ